MKLEGFDQQEALEFQKSVWISGGGGANQEKKGGERNRMGRGE